MWKGLGIQFRGGIWDAISNQLDLDGDEIGMEPVKRGWWLMSLFIDTAAAAGG